MRFLNATLLAAPHWRNTYGAVWAITGLIITLLQGFLMGCKDIYFPFKKTGCKDKKKTAGYNNTAGPGGTGCKKVQQYITSSNTSSSMLQYHWH